MFERLHDLVFLFYFGISEKEIVFFVLGLAHGDPIFAQIRPKIENFQGFWHFFFCTTGFQLKLLILNPLTYFIGNQLKKITRKVTFEGQLGPHFCPIWVKNGKKLIIFKNFTLVSQS